MARVDVGEAVVEAEAGVDEPGAVVGAPLVAQAVQLARQHRVVGEHHPALGGGELLVGVEAVDGRVAERAELAPVVRAVDRLAGVLHPGQAVALGDLHQRGHLGRVAEDVDDQDRLGAGRDGRLDRRRVHVERERVDLGEHRRGAGEQDRVGGRDERERRGDDLVARPEAERVQAEVQAGGAARHGHGVLHADAIAPRLLEPRHHRAQRQLPRPEHLVHELPLAVADDRLGEGDALRAPRSPRGRGPVARDAADAVLEAVDQRPPGRLDDVLAHADRAPAARCRRSSRAARG